MNVIRFLEEKKLTVSRSEGRRLVACGIVKINSEKEQDVSRELEEGDVVECQGKSFVFTEKDKNSSQ